MPVTIDPVFGITDTTTRGMVVPTGTTAERPQDPPIGFLRVNTDENQVEFYDGIQWVRMNPP